MKNYKKKSGNIIIYTLIGVVIMIVFLIILEMVFSKDESKLQESMRKEGYVTENESDAFYKRNVTNNTLDEYYNDISNKKDSSYEEYYLAKASLNFLEVKLNYSKGTTTALNFTSDLKTQEVNYNYEYSKDKAYLLLEGSSKDNYNCTVINNRNVDATTIDSICVKIKEDLKIYLDRRDKVLSNKEVQELINK